MANPNKQRQLHIRADDDFHQLIETYARSKGISISDAIRHLCRERLAAIAEVEFDQTSNDRRAELDEYLFLAVSQLVLKLLPGTQEMILLEAAKSVRLYHTRNRRR